MAVSCDCSAAGPVRWGQVVATSPDLTVRVAGDATDTRITVRLGVTPTVGQRVVLLRVGVEWVLAGGVVTV